MADRPLTIDMRNPLLLKANDVVVPTPEDGNFPLNVPGFGLFYGDTCHLGAYALRLHGTASRWHPRQARRAMKVVRGSGIARVAAA